MFNRNHYFNMHARVTREEYDIMVKLNYLYVNLAKIQKGFFDSVSISEAARVKNG